MNILQEIQIRNPLGLFAKFERALKKGDVGRALDLFDRIRKKIDIDNFDDETFLINLITHCETYKRTYPKSGNVFDQIIMRDIEISDQSYLSYRSKGGETALILAAKHNKRQAVIEITKKIPREGFSAQDNQGYTALHYAIESCDEIIVKLLAAEMYPEDLLLRTKSGKSSLDLASMQKKEFKEMVIKLIPDPRTLPPSIPDLPNAHALVEKVLVTRQSTLALEIGQEILALTNAFFEAAQQRGSYSLAQGVKVSDNLSLLVDSIQGAKESFDNVLDAPQQLENPKGIMGPIVSLVRKYIPDLDPHAILTRDFSDVRNMINQAVEFSRQVIKGYENFYRFYPKLEAEIDQLTAVLAYGIGRIDERIHGKEADTISDDLDLRSIFTAINDNALANACMLKINLQTNQSMKSAEVQFVTSVMRLHTALNTVLVNTSLEMAKIKSAASPEIELQSRQIIEDQLVKVGQNLVELRDLIEDRSMKISRAIPQEELLQLTVS